MLKLAICNCVIEFFQTLILIGHFMHPNPSKRCIKVEVKLVIKLYLVDDQVGFELFLFYFYCLVDS